MRRKNRKTDEKYKAWIRSLACAVCAIPRGRIWSGPFGNPVKTPFTLEQTTRTEAAHVGPRGLGQKCSDRQTLPLCAQHHRTGKDSHHTLQKHFWSHHNLDRDALIAELNTKYEQERAA